MNRFAQINLSLCCILAVFTTQAQINTFPYVEDFEGFTTTQTTGSCAAPAGINASGWTQLAGDDGDWRADTLGTPSVGTGPGATRTTSGDGIGVDANPGNANGRYLYTEATGCFNVEFALLSPSFDFSATDSFYRLTFSYHMYGSGIGSLHIDVYENGVWYTNQWVQVGEKDSVWSTAVVNMAAFNSDSVHIRVRGITGGTFESDICFDNVKIETYTPPTYDAVMVLTANSWVDYPIRPLSQTDSVSFWAQVRNEGVETITGTEVTISHGSYSQTLDFDSLESYEFDSGRVVQQYYPTTVGDLQVEFVVEINENDSFPANDTAYSTVVVSDSTLARENSNSSSGLGFGGASGFMGHYLDVSQDDTLTSISFLCQGIAGDSARVHLFSYGTAPGTIIESSEAVALTGTRQWYTLRLKCEQILTAGRYFIALEQMGINNILLGTEGSCYKPNSAYYSTTGATWTPTENANFLVCFLLRMNFGEVQIPDINIVAHSDTVCELEVLALDASGGVRYQWSPSNLFPNPTAQKQFVKWNQSSQFTVEGFNACGFSSTAGSEVYIEPGPTLTHTPDTVVCVGDTIVLQARTSNAYQWVGGPSNMPYTKAITVDQVIQLKVDSANGCSKLVSIAITTSQAQVEAYGDTTVCSGSEANLGATGADSYVWENGSVDSLYKPVVMSTTDYVVTGYNQRGCSATDTVEVVALQSPELLVTADTGVCFKDSAYLTAYGADSIQWIDGPATNIYPLRVLKAFDYIVEGHNNNGCIDVDTVTISLYFPPAVTLDEDTTVCENSSVVLNASGGDVYKWSTGDETASITYSPIAEGYVSVAIANSAGCTVYDSLYVGIDPLPEAAFSVFVEEDSIQLSNESADALSYSWDFGDGESSTDMSPYHLYDSSGTYSIKLTASNDCGSVDSTIEVEITIPTGSINDPLHAAIEVYPVPTQGPVFINLKEGVYGKLVLDLVDLNGKLMWSAVRIKSSAELSIDLDLTDMAKGAYLLTIKGDEIEYSVRLIKY